MKMDRREDKKMQVLIKKKARHLGAADEQEVSLKWTPKPEDIVKVEVQDLLVADYILGDGRCGVERKSNDFVTELRNGNLWLKLDELRQYPFHILLIDKDIEGLIMSFMPRNYDNDKEAWENATNRALGAIVGCILRGYVPLFTDNKERAAHIMVALDMKLRDGKDRSIVEAGRRYATRADHSIGILQRFPGIGVIKARKLLSGFKDFRSCLQWLMDIDGKTVEEVRERGLTSREKEKIGELLTTEYSTKKKKKGRKRRR